MTLALALSDGARTELGSPAWLLGGYPRHQGPSPGWRGGAGWQEVRGAHVLLMMWNFSPFWNVRSSSVLAS